MHQRALEAEAKPVHAGRQAPPGRAAGAAADGGAVREGQPITRAALQRSCCAARGDCARGHGGACGAAELSGLGFLQGAWGVPFFQCFFLHVFGAVPLNTKNGAEGHPPAFFIVFWARSKAVSLGAKNGEEGHRALFFAVFAQLQKRCHSASKMKQGFYFF